MNHFAIHDIYLRAVLYRARSIHPSIHGVRGRRMTSVDGAVELWMSTPTLNMHTHVCTDDLMQVLDTYGEGCCSTACTACSSLDLPLLLLAPAAPTSDCTGAGTRLQCGRWYHSLDVQTVSTRPPWCWCARARLPRPARHAAARRAAAAAACALRDCTPLRAADGAVSRKRAV